MASARAGTCIRQPEGYRAFIPAPLPPDPPIQIDGELIHLLSEADRALGRLLITFLLCERQILQRPLLYLSSYLNAHRSRYYDRLTAVRTEGDWEGWLRFFLQGVHEVSSVATEIARAIVSLRKNIGDSSQRVNPAVHTA